MNKQGRHCRLRRQQVQKRGSFGGGVDFVNCSRDFEEMLDDEVASLILE
jgi:hypothetical protein